MSEDDAAGNTARGGWRGGEISGPALLLLLVVLVIGGLGGASIGGGFGLAVTLIVLAAMVALLVVWSGAPDRTLHAGTGSITGAADDH